MSSKSREPVFRNRTKIDQLVYDESYSPIVVPPGKTIRGEWYKRYAGKRGPLALLSKDEDTEKKDDQDQSTIDGEGQE